MSLLSLIPTALWQAIGGVGVAAFTLVFGRLWLTRRDASKVAQGRAEAELRQREDVARRREAMAAVPKPSKDETIARLRRGEG